LLKYTDNKQGQTLQQYTIDNVTMQINSVLPINPSYDVRTRPFYVRAKASLTGGWVPVYVATTVPLSLVVTYSSPYLPKYTPTIPIKGVFSVNLGIEMISAFLKTQVTQESQVLFIMERTGLLIASSVGEVSLNTGTNLLRVPATNHSSSVVKDTANFLLGYFQGSLNNVSGSYSLSFYDSSNTKLTCFNHY
jgi:hypothetical protein